jgi:myo-inositol-1(or 4)-monophosphatase
MPHGFAADAALLRAAVQEAGALAMTHYHSGLKSWDKSQGDPVSEADIAIDRLLHKRLQETRPAYGWLSEETADSDIRLGKARVWIVDPIDGTRAFIQQRPEFAIAAALVEDGEPVLAAVFNPATDQYFFAAKGQGAELNGRPITVSRHAGLANARFMGGKKAFEHHGWLRDAPGASFAYRNSIAYRMALVANGEFEAALSFGEKSDWDVAAADLLVREAGGCVTTPTGRRFAYNGKRTRHADLIAAAPGVHTELMALMRSR